MCLCWREQRLLKLFSIPSETNKCYSIAQHNWPPEWCPSGVSNQILVLSSAGPLNFQEEAGGQVRRGWGSSSIWPVRGDLAIPSSHSLEERPSVLANIWALAMPSRGSEWPWAIINARSKFMIRFNKADSCQKAWGWWNNGREGGWTYSILNRSWGLFCPAEIPVSKTEKIPTLKGLISYTGSPLDLLHESTHFFF